MPASSAASPLLFSPRFWLPAVLVVAFAVRLSAGIWWQQRLPDGERFAFGDSDGYWRLAGKIAEGEPYQYGSDQKNSWPPPARIFRTPGYPILLSGLFLLSDHPPVVWARALNALLGTITVALVALLAARLFDQRTALIAAVLTAVYPGAIAMSIFVLAEAPFCPLMLLQLILWVAAWKSRSPRRRIVLALLGGMIAGAATLVRPSWLLFSPFAAGVGLVVSQDRRRQAAIGMCMLAGLVLVMSPWWVRNYRISGRFVPTTLQVGASLYDGLNPKATGASDMWFVPKFFRDQAAADAESTPPLESTFEYRADRRMRGAALNWANNHPGKSLRLAGAKLARMWNVWPNAAEFRSWPMRTIVMIGFAPLFVLAVWGAVKYARCGWPYVICCLPAIYFTCLHVVFVSSIRYRQPAMLPMIILAAAVVCSLYSLRSRRKVWHGSQPANTE